MTRHVLTASASTTLPEAMAMMVDGHFRHLPIVDSGRVIGMISMRDLMAWAALRLRHGAFDADDDVDTAELLADDSSHAHRRRLSDSAGQAGTRISSSARRSSWRATSTRKPRSRTSSSSTGTDGTKNVDVSP